MQITVGSLSHTTGSVSVTDVSSGSAKHSSPEEEHCSNFLVLQEEEKRDDGPL